MLPYKTVIDVWGYYLYESHYYIDEIFIALIKVIIRDWFSLL